MSATALPNDQVSGTLATSEFSGTVTVEDAPPVVVRVTPAPRAAGVGPEANVTATFSEAMRATTVDATTFVLAGKVKNTRVPAVVRYYPDRKRAVLNPVGPVRAGVTYVARVRGGDAGVRDSAGKALVNDKVWGFTGGG